MNQRVFLLLLSPHRFSTKELLFGRRRGVEGVCFGGGCRIGPGDIGVSDYTLSLEYRL